MTPKAKAKELVNKYKPFVYCYSGSGMLINQEDEGVILNNAKQCALIAVNEILNDDWYIPSFDEMTERKKYWEQVKNEINNL